MSKMSNERVIIFQSVDEMPSSPVSLGSMKINKTASWRSIRPIIIDAKCERCMICWKFCPEPAIQPTDPPTIDYDFCKGCGICIEECPCKAIIIEKEGK